MSDIGNVFSSCDCCGKRFVAKDQDQVDCPRCSTNVLHRSDLRFCRTSSALSNYSKVPAAMQQKHAGLLERFHWTQDGFPINCLSARPDIGGVRAVSKSLWTLGVPPRVRVGWALVAHRLWCLQTILDCLLPFAKKSEGHYL